MLLAAVGVDEWPLTTCDKLATESTRATSTFMSSVAVVMSLTTQALTKKFFVFGRLQLELAINWSELDTA